MDPFFFKTSVQSVQLTGLRASNLAELDRGLREVDGSSIYHHTHRFYRSHSFMAESPFSDFAFWTGENLREAGAAERMGALDLRDYATIRDLRNALLATLEPFRGDPDRWERRVSPGLEFHFCRSTSLILPEGYTASNVEQFIHALERVDTSCIYYHLIEAPLHLEKDRDYRNDFSEWLSHLPECAEKAREIADLDPYRWDLEQLRGHLLSVFKRGRLRSAARRLLVQPGSSPSGGVIASWMKRWRKGD